jgi:Zn-dependent peptidase ImmA (M78 family)
MSGKLTSVSNRHVVFGDRIRQARVLRQMKSTDLSAAAGISPGTLTRWEQSDRIAINCGSLMRMIAHLEFDLRFFEKEPAPLINEEDLRFRTPKSTLKREKDYLIQFARMVEEVFRWVDNKQQLPPVILPRLDPDSDIIESAQLARRAFNAKEGRPIGNLTLAVERSGIPIIRRPVKESADPGTNVEKHLGYTAWSGQYWERPIIICQGVPSWERTRWTVAHEVGHAVLHRSLNSRGLSLDPRGLAESEQSANRFASELLAPINAIRPELPRIITLFSLIEIKQRWGLSIGALIKHLHSAKVINDARRDTLWAQLYTRKNPETGTTYGLFEPGWNDREPERPGMLRYWLERTIHSSDSRVVAAMMDKTWPSDILNDLLVEQNHAAKSKESRKQGTQFSASESKSSHLRVIEN